MRIGMRCQGTRRVLAAVVLACGWLALPPAAAQSPAPRPPARRIIDVHMHAYAADARWTARVPTPVSGTPMTAVTETGHREATVAEMRRHNVVLAVVSGNLAGGAMARWLTSDTARFRLGVAFDGPDEVTVEALRAEYRAGRLQMIGEIGAPYAGRSAGDSAYEKFFTLAEELDIPIAVHAGTAGGGATYNGSPRYRMELNRPLHLEEMLARHPRARVLVMHAGWPFVDETVALLGLHPQVSVDLGVIAWTQPRAAFHSYLRRLLDSGFGKRIMFGSDQMVWPDAIGMAVEAIEAAPFLTAAQKDDIFHGNAARFLRLQATPAQ